MKSIYRKFTFHYTFLLVAIGFVLTGHFLNLVIFTSIIIFHELGHVSASLLFKYDIEKITIYPYGGLTKLKTFINTDISKDLLVAVAGVIFQVIYFLIITFFFEMGLLRAYSYNLFKMYHQSTLIFNLLPIIPLDGSKIVNLILSKYFSFNLANKITIVISLISLIFVLKFEIFDINYSTILIISILMKNIYRSYEELDYIYNKFMLERYLYKFNYPRIKIIKNKNKMYKNREHFFLWNNKIIPERDYLRFFYKND